MLELHLDYKLILVGALFVALVLAKLVAGNRPNDRPVRRKRRFGYKGTLGPLARPGARDRPAEPEKPCDPEEEFFKSKP